MKKVFAMAAIALFMMTSCSDDSSSSNNNTDSVLLKKKIEVTDGETLTSTYTYDGTKLTKITYSDDSYSTLTYSGDKPVSSKYYESGELLNEDSFSYTADNKLKTHIITWHDGGESGDYMDKYDYTYNANGTITMVESHGNVGAEPEVMDTYTITMANGNIISVNGTSGTNVYTFDTKNSPYKNVTGADILNLAYYEGGMNNTLTYSSSEYDESSTTTYTYNSSDYPTASTETSSFGSDQEVTTAQYFYE